MENQESGIPDSGFDSGFSIRPYDRLVLFHGVFGVLVHPRLRWTVFDGLVAMTLYALICILSLSDVNTFSLVFNAPLAQLDEHRVVKQEFESGRTITQGLKTAE